MAELSTELYTKLEQLKHRRRSSSNTTASCSLSSIEFRNTSRQHSRTSSSDQFYTAIMSCYSQPVFDTCTELDLFTQYIDGMTTAQKQDFELPMTVRESRQFFHQYTKELSLLYKRYDYVDMDDMYDCQEFQSDLKQLVGVFKMDHRMSGGAWRVVGKSQVVDQIVEPYRAAADLDSNSETRPTRVLSTSSTSSQCSHDSAATFTDSINDINSSMAAAQSEPVIVVDPPDYPSDDQTVAVPILDDSEAGIIKRRAPPKNKIDSPPPSRDHYSSSSSIYSSDSYSSSYHPELSKLFERPQTARLHTIDNSVLSRRKSILKLASTSQAKNIGFARQNEVFQFNHEAMPGNSLVGTTTAKMAKPAQHKQRLFKRLFQKENHAASA